MIELNAVSKTYKGHIALAETTRTFDSGKTTVLIGPSGCGKSTLLRIIVGLVTPDTGSVKIDGTQLNQDNVLALRRKIGYMIQDGGLFPHLTAKKNAALLPNFLNVSTNDIESKLDELCALVRMPNETLSRFPSELSGGQRQRVALIRALMLDPTILLLDEPLGALDPITRFELQSELKEIFARLGKTVIMVTHDLAEAAFLGDEIVLMRDGSVVQSGSYSQLRDSPSDKYVTSFLKAQRMPMSEGASA